MASKLDSAISTMIGNGQVPDRYSALVQLERVVHGMGLFAFAKMYGLLGADGSSTDFAIEFMSAFNSEVCFGVF